MIFPQKRNFFSKTKKGDIVPIYKDLRADCETPVSAFLKFKDKYKYLYLLESVENNAQIGRYTFLGIDADFIFTSKNNKVYITKNGKTTEKEVESPIQELEKLTKKFKPALAQNMPPFYGGAVGYFAYNIIRFFEKLPYKKKQNDLDIPDMCFMFSKNVIVFDKMKNSIKIIVNAQVTDNKEKDYETAITKLSEIENILFSNYSALKSKKQKHKNIKFKSNTTKQEYMNMVKQGKEYIRKGDIFQVVLSHRWEIENNQDLFDIYRNLRTINPSPYMFFLKFDDTALIGSSPEVMVKSNQKEIIVRPIAGTRPRGETTEKDLANEAELLADEKERAEHVMLVDLGRNDVGRIADKGTVKVDEFMVIERYSHVMHIVSQVRGKISEDKGLYEILKATFPAGTVSGAPKIRAMEIIEELEKNHRAAYAGSVAYIGFSGNFDSCITIRTIYAKNNKLYLQAGAGIVADSDPAREYDETVNKIKALFKAIESVK
jgi:anthranilate synthase component I